MLDGDLYSCLGENRQIVGKNLVHFHSEMCLVLCKHTPKELKP